MLLTFSTVLRLDMSGTRGNMGAVIKQAVTRVLRPAQLSQLSQMTIFLRWIKLKLEKTDSAAVTLLTISSARITVWRDNSRFPVRGESLPWRVAWKSGSRAKLPVNVACQS